jgi:cation-transporting ATPase 13A3/4/5
MTKKLSSSLTALSAGPFVATICVTLAATACMVLNPARWLRRLMQLTDMSLDFRLYIVALGLVYLVVAWAGENYVFQRLARAIGHARQAAAKTAKKRKEYKVIAEQMLS